MPIEIKELNIKINVSDNQNQTNSTSNEPDPEQQNDLISRCVEQVLDILSKTQER
ncbi:MAG: DUF5908 family protein [Prolixibacteraceae bacterium]